MNIKKIGIWGGGFIGSFLVILVLVYFLFPYLSPKKADKAEEENSSVQQATFDPGRYSMGAVDSLNQEISKLESIVDSLQKDGNDKQQIIDSLKTELQMAYQNEAVQPETVSGPAGTENTIAPLEEATKPLLSLDEDALAPIVDLLEEHQLISLYREGSGRQREKLLRTLKPEKAATILKKVM